ncbi:7-cyano-7-deazaguanine tRNA-ribosyltransferase [Plakobranchus ocellatus]|uniref:7-cyano-7-deazaguanine tRNA-ribosyltransferase n=1 Tax=Plakobranchus ocellatus TaxID=259542 RepID=A0AAV4B569_9GAST|nr:7-cyano-7-deazaguanine tRNA-ribosyltransferase [Plakobranchus ocellatus]
MANRNQRINSERAVKALFENLDHETSDKSSCYDNSDDDADYFPNKEEEVLGDTDVWHLVGVVPDQTVVLEVVPGEATVKEIMPEQIVPEHEDVTVVHTDCGDASGAGIERYKCKSLLSDIERQIIHKQFWNLDPAGKDNFYDTNTVQLDKASKRTKKPTPRRSKTIQYIFHFNGRKVRVCQEFFCGTLDISDQRVKYFHKAKKDSVNRFVKKSRWGKNCKKVISANAKANVRMHIEQLPRVESHYCRSSSSKEYLDADLSISKLYDMCVKWCEERSAEVVRKHMYTSIFNQEYNISFVKPKKDMCDMCEKFRLKEKEKSLNEEDRQLYHAHRLAVENSRVEKKKDKETEDVIVSFDLEKVLTLPKADISIFFLQEKVILLQSN